MKKTSLLLLCAFALAACSQKPAMSLTEEECKLINESPEVMRVVTVATEEDSLFLRKQSSEFNVTDINSDEFKELSRKMVATLVSPEQNGVGIAGPQVGLSRRIIAVMRYDKEGKPIEVYANPYIVETRGEKEPGPEGCLSVPGRRGTVPRWQDITITYTDSESAEQVREDIKGFTAVIFQHEIDHLDGIIYTDKTINQ